MERKTGTVIFFSDIRKYGFIKPDDGGHKDIFCHFTQLQMEGYKIVQAGDIVSYEMGENHKGPMAVNVVIEKRANEKS